MMKWASWTSLVLGLWLIVAPFALGYGGTNAPTYEAVILGIAIALLAFWAAGAAEAPTVNTASWLVAAAGLWVLIAPFALGYTVTAATYNDVLVGLAVLVLGASRAFSVGRHARHDMAAQHH